MSKETSLLKKSAYGTLIPAGLFVGIGAGLLTNHIVADTLIGFGLGLAFAYSAATKK